MIIFGLRSHVKQMALKLISLCPHCKMQALSMGSIIQYFHIWFIPIFPVSNNKVIVCEYCKNQRNQAEFTPEENEVLKNQEIQDVLGTPKWAFAGILVFLTFFFPYIVIPAVIIYYIYKKVKKVNIIKQ